MSIINEAFGRHLEGRFETEPVMQWQQRAPIKNGLVTFAHSNVSHHVPGLVELKRSGSGLSLSYTSSQPLHGLWTRYERPGFKTEPFVTLALDDSAQGNLKLLDAADAPVEHWLPDEDISIVRFFMTIRAQEKFLKINGLTEY